MNPKIISVGEVLWDLFDEGEQFGGAPANFACHAAIHGADVTMLSAVGNDRRGSEALKILGRYGIDTRLVQILDDASTGTVGVAIDSAGKPTFSIHEGSAWDRIAWTSETEATVKAADSVYFGTLGQRSDESRGTIRRIIKAARDKGIPRIVDINLRAPFFDDALIRDSIKLASILKLSDEELPDVCVACRIPFSDLREEAEDSLRLLRDSCDLDLVVMTRGADGAVLVTSDKIVTQSGIPTTIRDTVGAGDSFTAAFLLGLLRGEPHDQILREACVVAGKACTHAGAVPKNDAR
jgi:fructokinase